MRTGDLDGDIEREQHCEALGDAVAEAIPAPAPGAPGPLADDVARALSRRPRLKLRPAWKWAPALALGMTAAAFVVIPMVRPQPPLAYELSGTYAARDDGFETPGTGTATARFSDGTSIAVGAHSAAQVKARTRAGATIRLDRGRASFAVVHRPGAKWNVEVGPFEIAVTGTEFDVHWSDDHQGFEVVMKSGTVVVRGSLTGAGIPLHAGQRLEASLANGTLVVSEAEHAERVEAAPPQVVAPRDEAVPAKRGRLVAQAAPVRDVAPAGESAEALARRQALSPPPFEPAPPPATAPALAPAGPAAIETMLGMGGASCNDRPLPQIRFEHASEGFRVLAGNTSSVFRSPVLDHTTSWCGGGSLRLDGSFDISDQSLQSGEVVVYLPHAVDLRGKTVTIRFMARAPFVAEFEARILAGQGERRTGNSYNPHLTTGTWWTISNTFHEPAATFDRVGGDYVGQVDRIILKVDATGSFRVWSGPIYIDDIGWR